MSDYSSVSYSALGVGTRLPLQISPVRFTVVDHYFPLSGIAAQHAVDLRSIAFAEQVEMIQLDFIHSVDKKTVAG